MLGTVMVCCFFEIIFSFVPKHILRKLFPPVVSGTSIVLLGTSLAGAFTRPLLTST
jgi:xanthine/uracil permease